MKKLQHYIDNYNQIIQGLDVTPRDWCRGFDLYLEQQRVSQQDIECMAFMYHIEKYGSHEHKTMLNLV